MTREEEEINGWRDYRRLVLSELERQSRQISDFDAKVVIAMRDTEVRIARLEERDAAMGKRVTTIDQKVGWILGLLGSIILAIVGYAIKFWPVVAVAGQ